MRSLWCSWLALVRWVAFMGLTEWEADCMKWRGRVLTGRFAHWCYDWDGLPVDETTPDEFECCGCTFEGVAMQKKRMTIVDDKGIRHQFGKFGLICKSPTPIPAQLHDEAIYTGVEEGYEQVVNCVTCMAGEADMEDDELLAQLRKSVQS